MDARAIFRKTPRGDQELRLHKNDLSPRIYQLLPLINGQRDLNSLSKLFAAHELDAYLTVLHAGGFIEPDPTTARQLAAAKQPDNKTSHFAGLREQALKRLLEHLGTAGEPFALRVAKCQTHQELSKLVRAMQSVVEVRCGPTQAARFAREALQQ